MCAFIVMADIINSSSYDGKELMNDFEKVVDHVNKAYKRDLVSPLTITLGDEFQGVVKDLAAGLKVLFEIEESIILQGGKFKLRYVLNQGKIETSVNRKEAYKMLGPGLSIAREQLVAYKKSGNRFKITLNDNLKSIMLNQAYFLYEHLVDAWHEKDFEIVGHFLSGKDYRDIAGLVDRDESSVWRRERSLGIKAYQTSKDLINNLVHA